MTPFIFLAGLSSLATASVPDLIGMGPANVGAGGAATAVANDAYAPYYNPAGLTQLRRITLSAAPVLGEAQLFPFSGIVYDTNGDGLTQDLLGAPDYGGRCPDGNAPSGEKGTCATPSTNGIQLGLVVPFWNIAAFGLAAYLPNGSLIRIATADPALPYYVMFAHRNDRFSAVPALSLNPHHGLHLGVGLQLMADIQAKGTMSANVNASAFSSSEDEDAPSVDADITANVDALTADVIPTLAFNAGILLDGSLLVREHTETEKAIRLRRHAIGAAYRAPWKATTTANITANTTGLIQLQDDTVLLSDLVAEPLEISLEDLIGFYTPAQATLGIRTGFGDVRMPSGKLDNEPRFMLSADAVWTGWSQFQEMTGPAQELTINALEGTSVTVHVGEDLGDPGFKDTFSYRAGTRLTLGPWDPGDGVGPMRVHLRAGGGYVPSPIPRQTGRTNYIDNDRIIGTAGLGIETSHLRPVRRWNPAIKGPVSFDVGGQFHYLVPRIQNKSEELLADTDGDGIIEYPRGYPLGGSIVSGGIYWAATAGLQFQLADPQESVWRLRDAIKRDVRTAVQPAEGPAPTEGTTVEPPADAAAPVDGAEGALAIPAGEEGAETAPAAEETGKKAKKDKKDRKSRKAKAAEEAPATDASLVPTEDAEAAPPEASADAPAKEKKKKEKKEKKGKKAADAPVDDPSLVPPPEGAAPDAVEGADAPATDTAEPEKAKKAKKEKKKKDKKSKGEEVAPLDALEESLSAEPPPDAPPDLPPLEDSPDAPAAPAPEEETP